MSKRNNVPRHVRPPLFSPPSRAATCHRGSVFPISLRRLTHNYVVAEFVVLAQVRKVPRPKVLRFAAELHNNAATEMVYVSQGLHRAALALLAQRPDKSWSLCDAVSFVLMRQDGIEEALTTDHHFEQAGFVRLLKP